MTDYNKFDAIEIMNKPDQTELYGIYGHLMETGGYEWLGDCKTLDEAKRVAEELSTHYNLPVYNLVSESD